MKKLALLAFVGMPLAAAAQIPFVDNFDVDSTANWAFNSSIAGDGALDNTGNEANFFFDYSTVGIPSAPGSHGTTRGLKLQSDVFGTVSPNSTEAVSVSPIGKGFAGNYVLRFDAWQNFQGSFPGGGNGTTQALIAGVGAVDETRQWIANKIDGAAFAATNDGGSANDYRAYTNFGSIVGETTGAYAAGSVAGVTNGSNAYYSGFQGTVPAAQTAIAAGYSPAFTQAGSTSTGVLGMAWHRWEITRFKDTVTWKVDGLRIATVTKSTFGGDNIFLGYFDTNGNPSTDAVSNQLLFGLVDNVSVQAVPEPGTMVALGLGAAALLRRRKRA